MALGNNTTFGTGGGEREESEGEGVGERDNRVRKYWLCLSREIVSHRAQQSQHDAARNRTTLHTAARVHTSLCHYVCALFHSSLSPYSFSIFMLSSILSSLHPSPIWNKYARLSCLFQRTMGAPLDAASPAAPSADPASRPAASTGRPCTLSAPPRVATSESR